MGIGVIAWLVAIGCLFVGAGVGVWGLTDAPKEIPIWALGVPGAILIVLAGGFELQSIANKEKVTPQLSPEAAAQRIVASAQAAMQRAWVSVKPEIVGDIKIGAPLKIRLITENVGKEPAIGTSHRGMVMMFPTPGDIGYAPDLWTREFDQVVHAHCDGAYPIEGRATIFPGDKQALETAWTNLQDINDLIDGKKILVTFGCLGYLTVGTPHYTWYCFFLMRDKQGDWRLGSALVGNGAT